MASKEEVKNMVDSVCVATNQTQEELAVALGYGKTYISEMFAPTGKVTDKFVRKLRMKYGKSLDFSDGKTYGEDYALEYKKGDQQPGRIEQINDRLLQMLERHLEWMRDKVDTNLDATLSGLSAISVRQAVDREVVYRSLARLEKKSPDALIMEADKILSGALPTSDKPDKKTSSGNNGKRGA